MGISETHAMTFKVPVDLQPFVNEQLQLGCFRSEQELIVEALRLLKADREESLAGICLGLADAAAGRTQPLAAAFADLRREFNLSDPV
jgi:Arc/MetJ-type ribon-helix-helix transcriptional regulator